MQYDDQHHLPHLLSLYSQQKLDDDELFDYEEVNVYNTDPLDPDTDGDSYLDGAEVKGGYNPSGPGRLLNIEDEISNINQSN